MAATRVLKELTDSDSATSVGILFHTVTVAVCMLQDLLSFSILFGKHLKDCFNKMELLTIVGMLNSFFKHLKFVCKYSNFIQSSKMTAVAGRPRTTAAASPTSLDHPAGGPRQTTRQSPTGVSQPTITTDDSSKRPTTD